MTSPIETATELMNERKVIFDKMFKQNEEYGLRNNWEPQNIIKVTYTDLKETDESWNIVESIIKAKRECWQEEKAFVGRKIKDFSNYLKPFRNKKKEIPIMIDLIYSSLLKRIEELNKSLEMTENNGNL